MKIKMVFPAVLVLTIVSFGFAQTKPRPNARPAKFSAQTALAPDRIVTNVYAEHKAGRGPFNQNSLLLASNSIRPAQRKSSVKSGKPPSRTVQTVDAVQTFGGRHLSGIKADFKSVAVVALVEIENIELAASDLASVYRVESKTLETFKGKTDESLTFYFSADEGYDAERLIGKKWIVFLEAERQTPSGDNVRFELENSKLPASEKLVAQLRKLKNARKKH
jgi:hypothetical protein